MSEKINVLGVADVDVAVEGGVTEKLRLVIVQGLGPWIRRIKFPWSELLGEEQVRCHYSEYLYRDVFKEELGCYNGGKANLLIDESAKPHFFKDRPVPLSLPDKVDRELNRLACQGVIKPVSYSDWVAPLVIVPKANGTVRLCGDFKLTVNKSAALEQYPLPRLEELFTSLIGCQEFSKLDSSHAYNQIELDEESQKCVVVNTPKWLKKVYKACFWNPLSCGYFSENAV